MKLDASAPVEAPKLPARRSGIWLIIFFLIAVSLACKAAQGDRRAAPSPTPEALLNQAVTANPAAIPTQTMAAPALITGTPTASPLSTAAPTLSLPTPHETLPAALPATLLAPTQGAAIDPQITAQQMRVFEEINGTIRERYLYPDFNGLDWNAVGQEYRAYIQAGISNEDFYKAMFEMVERLGDQHSTFFSPEEAALNDQAFQGQASYVGIGVMTTPILDRRRLAVLLVFQGSPAEAAGIRIHDSILMVDGQPVVTEERVRQDLLRGPEATTIQVTIQTPGQEPRVVSITRQAVTQKMPVLRRTIQSPGGKRIGYIYIPTLNEAHIDEEVGAAISELGNAGMLDGLIIDNRYNNGGASDVLLNTISYFIDGPMGYFIENRRETPLEVRGQDLLGSQSVPLVTLIGPGTISFGEVFSGALKDLGRAHLIGTQTDGNVEVLSIFNFSDGSRAWIATSTFRPLNNPDQNWEETGITPDQIVDTAWDLVSFESDPAILAALQYLDGLPVP